MAKRVAIVGTGQTFHKSHRPDVNGQELINEAVLRALTDADLKMKDIDAIVIGNMDHFEGINYVDCWSVDGSGGTMKPIIKLTTGGTTGCTVAIGGYHLVGSGMFDRVLIIGWENLSSDRRVSRGRGGKCPVTHGAYVTDSPFTCTTIVFIS